MPDATATRVSDFEQPQIAPRSKWGDIALILLLTVAVFLPAINNGFVDFDDRGYITQNPLVEDLSWNNLRTVWTDVSAKPYYPMVFTAYMLQYALWGENPEGYHAVSVLLHVLNALLAYLLVLKLFRNRTAALMTGLLTGLHPLHVDAVAWAGDLKDVLSGTFVFLCLHTYANYVQKGRRSWYLLSLVLYALALFAKPMSALLPFMLLIVDYQQRRKNRRLEVLEKVPFLVLAAMLGYVTLRTQVGAGGTEASAMSFYSPANAWTAIGFYLLKLTVPVNLSVQYASWHPTWWMVVATGLSIAYVTATVWMLMLSRDYGFGLAWFALLAAPILGFIPFGYVVSFAPYANHFMYLADFGLFVCAGLIAHDVLKHLSARQDRLVFYVLVVLAFTAFGSKTALRCNVWSDPVTLWRDSVRYNRAANATVGHYRLAQALRKAGDAEGARRHALLALRRFPENQDARKLLVQLERD